MEQLLSIFEEQSQTVVDMRHPIPPEYESILKRLHAALSPEMVNHARLAQEELLYEFATTDQALEEAKIREKNAILNLKNKGMSITEIASVFSIQEEEVKEYF